MQKERRQPILKRKLKRRLWIVLLVLLAIIYCLWCLPKAKMKDGVLQRDFNTSRMDYINNLTKDVEQRESAWHSELPELIKADIGRLKSGKCDSIQYTYGGYIIRIKNDELDGEVYLSIATRLDADYSLFDDKINDFSIYKNGKDKSLVIYGFQYHSFVKYVIYKDQDLGRKYEYLTFDYNLPFDMVSVWQTVSYGSYSLAYLPDKQEMRIYSCGELLYTKQLPNTIKKYAPENGLFFTDTGEFYKIFLYRDSDGIPKISFKYIGKAEDNQNLLAFMQRHIADSDQIWYNDSFDELPILYIGDTYYSVSCSNWDVYDKYGNYTLLKTKPMNVYDSQMDRTRLELVPLEEYFKFAKFDFSPGYFRVCLRFSMGKDREYEYIYSPEIGSTSNLTDEQKSNLSVEVHSLKEMYDQLEHIRDVVRESYSKELIQRGWW